jgi:hypothetical protein
LDTENRSLDLRSLQYLFQVFEPSDRDILCGFEDCLELKDFGQSGQDPREVSGGPQDFAASSSRGRNTKFFQNFQELIKFQNLEGTIIHKMRWS